MWQLTAVPGAPNNTFDVRSYGRITCPYNYLSVPTCGQSFVDIYDEVSNCAPDRLVMVLLQCGCPSRSFPPALFLRPIMAVLAVTG